MSGLQSKPVAYRLMIFLISFSLTASQIDGTGNPPPVALPVSVCFSSYIQTHIDRDSDMDIGLRNSEMVNAYCRVPGRVIAD